MDENTFKMDGNLDEHISPEGVEEKIVYDKRFLITQTQGGKFRVYGWDQSNRKYISIELKDDEKLAMSSCAAGMILAGGLIVDPDKIVEIITAAVIKKGNKS